MAQPSNSDVCEVICHDEDKVRRLRPKVGEVDGLAPLFKGLGDETRLRIAHALTVEKELCVCDVAAILGTTVATASHHLRLLKSLGLTKSRKEGKLVYYSLDDDHVRQIVRMGMEHLAEGKGNA
ncbi:DNA-binding transcriptional ArsR family regulator [Desmospora profundinema]|uniref:DNA-binding transcriptional ArsR family regulator n=1 Tax=Desmospora profundinema TaxID=1571184 RepID=A0ABU1IP90_9BACL|nr:metalloregulator ArsR/SmtB family transcription factor [Desmospora profundinema]MDR6226606.1 DNA-binding transcriptional ArsR family regulator [Desmospora profundinema]